MQYFTFKVTLFTEHDIEIMFSIFDLTSRGYVDHTQYLKGVMIFFFLNQRLNTETR